MTSATAVVSEGFPTIASGASSSKVRSFYQMPERDSVFMEQLGDLHRPRRYLNI